MRKKPKRLSVSSDRDSSHNTEEDSEEQSFGDWPESNALIDDDANCEADIQSECLEVPGTGKLAKTIRKREKHQAEVQAISAAELDRLTRVLHPELVSRTKNHRQDTSQGLNEDAIEENITFNPHFIKHSNIGAMISDKKAYKANVQQKIRGLPDDSEQRKAFLDSILEHLGLNSTLKRTTKGRKALAKLRTAISDDIQSVANEEAERMQRMAGYWRYVNRRQYNHMIRMNELWDWATGAKLPEIEEELDDHGSAESESDVALSNSTELGSSDTGTPPAEMEKEVGDLRLDEVVVPKLTRGKSDTELTTPNQAPEMPEEPCIILSPCFREGSLTLWQERPNEHTSRSIVPSRSANSESQASPDDNLGSGMGDITPRNAPNIPTFKDMLTLGNGRINSAEETKVRTNDRSSSLTPDTRHLASKENNPPNTPLPYRRALSVPAEQPPPISKDANNRYKGLKIELPAPREEETSNIPSTPITARLVPSSQRSAPLPAAGSPDVNSTETSNDSKAEDFPALPQTASLTASAEAGLERAKPKPKSISISLEMAEHFQAMEGVGKGKKRGRGGWGSTGGRGAARVGKGRESGGWTVA